MARSSLDPASAPATRKSVFLDTLPVAFAPSALTALAASVREKPSSLPVMTKVRPLIG